jgi:hypothetical protein
MKNFTEMRGQTTRVIFDPDTGQFSNITLPHPFLESLSETPDESLTGLTLVPRRRKAPKRIAVPWTQQQRVA